jgi:hypothetical protein
MLSCDYNGWNDAPEEEREWVEEYLEPPGELTRYSETQSTLVEKTSWPFPERST